jgi:hypothetical protein
MKHVWLSVLVSVVSVATIAQVPDTAAIAITSDSTIRDSVIQLNYQDESKVDTVIGPGHNIYGDLLKDDPAYNPRYPWWMPASRIAFTNVVNWAICRYVYKFEWARVNTHTWKNNIKHGWEWDTDRFGVNFIGHPHTGNYYFNIARANGYNFWQSMPFTIGGSLMWEYFGENTKPSRNDIINTPLSGAFLGEIMYRLSSNILDDRARGANRVWREIFAGLLNPPRAFNRLTQGKMFRHTNQEVYQKEPLNVTLSAGVHKVNTNNKFGTGATNAIINLQLDYGDPFEVRHRKPFDVFRFRMESRYGDDQKLIDNVLGYAVLFSKNIVKGKNGLLAGIFQHFDYWNNNVFELGTLGFGPGILSRIDFTDRINLYSGIHLAVVPLGASNVRVGPDTSEFRDYNFGGGMEMRIEETLNLTRWVGLGFTGYYYWLHNYEGSNGKSQVGILKPKVTFRLFRNANIGMEHHIYYNNRSADKNSQLRFTRTEQKFFLEFYFEDPRRRGKYH